MLPRQQYRSYESQSSHVHNQVAQWSTAVTHAAAVAALDGWPPLTPPPARPPARVFEERGFDFEWTVEEYGRMCEVGGGKERMTAYLNGFNGRRECVRRAATEEAARAFLSGRAL